MLQMNRRHLMEILYPEQRQESESVLLVRKCYVGKLKEPPPLEQPNIEYDFFDIEMSYNEEKKTTKVNYEFRKYKKQ